MRQLKLNIYRGTHGGRRPGAGRKRLHSKGVAHAPRESVTARTPVHINFKLQARLKNKFALRCLRRAIHCARRQGLGILHFSLQANHVHLIAEASDNPTLTRGMRALTISFSKALGQGRVQLERYHLHVLRTLREVRHALLYVLCNEQRHAGTRRLRADEYTSLSHFPRLALFARKMRLTIIRGAPSPIEVDEGRSWLARRGLAELSALRA